MAELALDATLRSTRGPEVRRIRREGMVPVVIYGKSQEPEHAQVSLKELDRVLSAGGSSQLVEVNLEGVGQRHILVRDVQREPVRHTAIHADFYAVNMKEKQQVSIPVVSVGRPRGLTFEIVLVHGLDQVEIEALPSDIPAHLEVDVTRLESPDSDPITVAELPKIEGVTYLTPENEVLFSLVLTRAAIEEETEAVDTDVEPEVIGRGHDEDEENEE